MACGCMGTVPVTTIPYDHSRLVTKAGAVLVDQVKELPEDRLLSTLPCFGEHAVIGHCR